MVTAKYPSMKLAGGRGPPPGLSKGCEGRGWGCVATPPPRELLGKEGFWEGGGYPWATYNAPLKSWFLERLLAYPGDCLRAPYFLGLQAQTVQQPPSCSDR